MGRVIAAAAYSAGRRIADITIEESGEWAARPGHFVWIGIEAPSERDLRQLQVQFGMHELALEDALNAHQRPKLETYGDTTFLVLRTAFLVDGHIALGETEIFTGRGYVISVRMAPRRPTPRYASGPRRCPSSCPTARITSCTRWSTLSSTIILLSSRSLQPRSRRSRSMSWSHSMRRGSHASTSCGASCRSCAW